MDEICISGYGQNTNICTIECFQGFPSLFISGRRQSSNDMTPQVLTLAGIKHFEMPEECHQYKGRIVYRGDRIKKTKVGKQCQITENETATTPTANFCAPAWTRGNSYVGTGWICEMSPRFWYACSSCSKPWCNFPTKCHLCNDCVQIAYLQCGTRWRFSHGVILPWKLWLPEWQRFGEVMDLWTPTFCGQRWQKHLEKQILKGYIGGIPRLNRFHPISFCDGETEISTLYYSIYM